MKLVIRMLLNMLSDRKPEWDSVFGKPVGGRCERASLSGPFLKKWGSRMKSVIRMSLNRWCDRKPGWDLIFGKPAGRDVRGLPSQVPFRRNEIFE